MANLAIDKHMSTKITAFLQESIRAPGHVGMPGSGGQRVCSHVCVFMCVFSVHFPLCFQFSIQHWLSHQNFYL